MSIYPAGDPFRSFFFVILNLLFAFVLTSYAWAADTLPIELTAPDAASISAVNSTVSSFLDRVFRSKNDEAAKFCVNGGENFLTPDFISDLKLFSGFDRKIISHSGSKSETVSVIVVFTNKDGDCVNCEFVLSLDEKSGIFKIVNIFDRQYEKMSPGRRSCYLNCEFLDMVWRLFPEIFPDHCVPAGASDDRLISEGFLASPPKCPDGGEYSSNFSYDAELAAYEVRVRCSKHGNSWELFKVSGNLDASEKISAEINENNKKMLSAFGTPLLSKLSSVSERAAEVYTLVQNDNMNEALAKFRELQKSDARAGNLYLVLSQALSDSGHDSEAVLLMNECAAVYPKWSAAKAKMARIKKNSGAAVKNNEEK